MGFSLIVLGGRLAGDHSLPPRVTSEGCGALIKSGTACSVVAFY